MTTFIADLYRRLEGIASKTTCDQNIEMKASEWIKYLMASHFEADTLWSSLGEAGIPILAHAEALAQAPSSFPDAQTEISFYLGSARTALEQVLTHPLGTAKHRAWQKLAQELIAEAEASVLRQARAVTHESFQERGRMRGAKWAKAREMATLIATERWDDWHESREGDCPRIGNVVNDILKAISADLRSLGLDATPTRETLKTWIRQDCKIPPEASQPGQRKRS